MASSAALVGLDSPAQIHDLVVRFYREVVFDDLPAPVFTDVAQVDWSLHIPKLVDYWCRVLVGEPGYDGVVLGAHRSLHDAGAFRPEHVDRRYELWVGTVDGGWQGPVAWRAKTHAARIAAVLARRRLAIDRAPAGPTSCSGDLSAPGGWDRAADPAVTPAAGSTASPSTRSRRPSDTGRSAGRRPASSEVAVHGAGGGR